MTPPATHAPDHAEAPIPRVRLASFYFCYYAALGAFNPFWSLYLKDLGYGVGAISVLMGLLYAMRMLAPGSWAALVAASSQPLRWLRVGAVLSLLGFAGVFFVRRGLPPPFAAMFAVSCAFLFFYNAIMPQFESITQSHLGARNAAYGRIRVWGSIGYVTVVMSYGRLLDAFGIAALPWLMLPWLLAMVAAAFANRYAHAPGERSRHDRAEFRQRLLQPAALAFFAATFLSQLAFGPFYTFYSIYLQEHGYSTTAQGLLWASCVLAEIGVFFFAARIFRRWDAGAVLVAAMLGGAVRWWATALWPDNAALMLAAQLLHALNFGAFFAAVMQLLARFFPGKLNGHGQGVFYGFSSGFGGVLGALLSGALWRHGGHVAFAAAGFASLLGAGIAWKWLVRPNRQAER